MNKDHGSNSDQDLLSRLNALKKSTIDLGDKDPTSGAPTGSSVDPSPGRALHSDLLDRFKTLTGTRPGVTPSAETEGRHPQQDKQDDDKTIEELFADLGPAEQWNISKSEADNVDDLLNSAKMALSQEPGLETVPGDPDQEAGAPNTTPRRPKELPSVDVTVFQPEPESEDDDGASHQRPSRPAVQTALDNEADDVLKRLMDEVNFERNHGEDEDETNSPTQESSDGDFPAKAEHHEDAQGNAMMEFPSTPSKDLEIRNKTTSQPEPDNDEGLAARFASLSLPSVPTGIKPPAKATGPKGAIGFTDQDVNDWCIICSDDANLRCLGCDRDLYCTNCWMEGHRGEDAGYEEKTHKAVQFVKGDGKKKQSTGKRRVMQGA